MNATIAERAEREAAAGAPGALVLPEETCARQCGCLGWVSFAARGGRLRSLTFGWPSAAAAQMALAVRSDEQRMRRSSRVTVTPRTETERIADTSLVDQLAERLERYAAGEVVDFEFVALGDEHLTMFQRKVLTACRAVRHGRTTSYAGLAADVGAPRAARAVGQVMACNPFPIVVPCHRVLQSSGAIGHYSAAGGVATKRQLLVLERIDLLGTPAGRKARKPR